MFRYKKRTLGVLFLVLEAISFILDQYGGSHLDFLVASVFVSLVGFLITGYNFTKSRSEVENEINVIELVFSIVQLIVTCIYFISATLEVKLKLNASVFPLVLAITAVALAFKNNEQVTNSSAIESQLISSNTSTVVDIEITDSLSPHIQGVSLDTPTVVGEEDITGSSALLLHVASSNTTSVVDDEVEESTDLRAPLISSNTPTMSDDESLTMSDDEEISRTSTPRGWFDVDEGTGWTDDDEEVIVARRTPLDPSIQEEEREINKIMMFPRMLKLRPHMTSAQSNLWQSTKMKDLKEEIWNFRLTIHPMPALTDGWLEFVQTKDLVPDDIVIFYKLRDEISGDEYRVEIDSEYKWISGTEELGDRWGSHFLPRVPKFNQG
ncbi:hypothetical protein LWI29_028330 [Acer saccharum]|uniref:TF-B3 domain-containing protein n=1 Tax=Acer saccharum TaxID=4024 RepID=A0AA39RDX4_ACESA|nr:hypothetical protein LWI29_028330 [Acer saccharum]